MTNMHFPGTPSLSSSAVEATVSQTDGIWRYRYCQGEGLCPRGTGYERTKLMIDLLRTP